MNIRIINWKLKKENWFHNVLKRKLEEWDHNCKDGKLNVKIWKGEHVN